MYQTPTAVPKSNKKNQEEVVKRSLSLYFLAMTTGEGALN